MNHPQILGFFIMKYLASLHSWRGKWLLQGVVPVSMYSSGLCHCAWLETAAPSPAPTQTLQQAARRGKPWELLQQKKIQHNWC